MRSVLAALAVLLSLALIEAAEARSQRLTTKEARSAMHRQGQADVRSGDADAYRLGRCVRETRRRLRCYMWETGAVPDLDAIYDGWLVFTVRERKHGIVVNFRRFL